MRKPGLVSRGGREKVGFEITRWRLYLFTFNFYASRSIAIESDNRPPQVLKVQSATLATVAGNKLVTVSC